MRVAKRVVITGMSTKNLVPIKKSQFLTRSALRVITKKGIANNARLRMLLFRKKPRKRFPVEVWGGLLNSLVFQGE